MKSTATTYKVGDKVTCNGGYPGTITQVCSGQLAGMVVVTLARGTACIGISDPGLRKVAA